MMAEVDVFQDLRSHPCFYYLSHESSINTEDSVRFRCKHPSHEVAFTGGAYKAVP